MKIKQLKLNGTAFYPKVGVDSIVNAAGEASAVDSTPTDGSTNLVTSGGVYSAIQLGSGSGAVKKIKSSGVEVTPDANGVADIGYIMSGKQNVLVSGTSIKTINNESLLGSGNIATADTEMSNSSTNAVQNGVITRNLLSITPIIKSESSFGSSCVLVIDQLRISGTQINPWKREGQATFNPALIEFTVGVVDINSSTRALNTHTFSYIISPGEGTEPTVSGREYNYQSLVDKFVSDLCEYYAGFSNGGSNSMIIRKTRDESYANVKLAVNITSTSLSTNHYQIVLSSFELAGYDTTGKDNKMISLALTTSSTTPETRSDIFYKTMYISKGDLGTMVTNPQTLWFNTTINHLMILDGQGRIYDCTTGSKFAFAPNYQQS